MNLGNDLVAGLRRVPAHGYRAEDQQRERNGAPAEKPELSMNGEIAKPRIGHVQPLKTEMMPIQRPYPIDTSTSSVPHKT